jgi:hypothetical protein
LLYKKGRESKGGKNKDKKIVMVKLIIQKKKGTATAKSSVCLVKVLDLFFGVQCWYWCLVFWALWARVLALLSDSLGMETSRGFFLYFFCFSWSYGPLQAGALKWFHQGL